MPLGLVTTLSAGSVAALLLTFCNLNIQLQFITFLWAKGCSPSQALDVYDLREKYNHWKFLDIVINFIIMLVVFACSSTVYSGLFWGTCFVELIALAALPIRAVTSKVAIHNNPNLLDFNGKYKNTHEEYKKLLLLLDERKLNSYRKSASNLWAELLLLNKRRQEAYESKKNLETIKADVQKLITTYNIEDDVENRLKSQARLNKIIEQEADIDDFVKKVEERIRLSETVFMDIRTNIAVGQLKNVLVDLDSYTVKVKGLEYTVRQLEK